MEKTIGKEYKNAREREAFLKDNCDKVEEKGYMKPYSTEELQGHKENLANVSIETAKESVLIGELAKIICQNGVQTGEKRLFQWLRDNHYLCAYGERYNQPTQKAMELGLFEMKKTTINKPNGETMVLTTTKVTGKGQVYFVNKFLYNNQKSIIQ